MSSTPWRASTWCFLILSLALSTLLIHGYHPFAEDGGLYIAGVEYTLDRSLFPHNTAFVTEHLRFSIFAPAIVAIVHVTHLSLEWTIFLVSFGSLSLTFFAARQVLLRCAASPLSQLIGMTLLAVWATLPIAGTSLVLIDPYVTARSLSTPLSLFALAYALDPWRRSRSAALSALCLLLAALFHPLMAAYAFAFVVCLRAGRFRRALLAYAILASLALACAATLQGFAVPESPSLVAAEITRYYWFLSRWQWYELLGLAGPLVILSILLRWPRGQTANPALRDNCDRLLQAAIALGVIASMVATLFAHEAYATHLVARLQPLRVFLPIYAVMILLLGSSLATALFKPAAETADFQRRAVPTTLTITTLLLLGSIMFFVQRLTFPASSHLEIPGRTSPNPWVQAFLWARDNTPSDAFFALDAHYITTSGEDAQTFRATARRSSLPDYSKDGGEAAITPPLALLWQQGFTAQLNLSRLSDTRRDQNLRPFGVTWMILDAAALTSHPCPYINGTLKVCRLTP